MKNYKLCLYYFDSCPFCVKVLNYLDKNNITIPKRDILLDPEAKETLRRIGGKTQVPCLFIDEKPLYESNDIIQWLEDHVK
jgi:glutaredoxin 3